MKAYRVFEIQQHSDPLTALGVGRFKEALADRPYEIRLRDYNEAVNILRSIDNSDYPIVFNTTRTQKENGTIHFQVRNLIRIEYEDTYGDDKWGRGWRRQSRKFKFADKYFASYGIYIGGGIRKIIDGQKHFSNKFKASDKDAHTTYKKMATQMKKILLRDMANSDRLKKKYPEYIDSI